MSSSTFTKVAGTNYAIFGNYTDDGSGNLTFTGQGLVVNKDTGDITAIGGANKVSSKSRFSKMSAADDVLVNGSSVDDENWKWAPSIDLGQLASSGIMYTIKDGLLYMCADTPGSIVLNSPTKGLTIVNFQFTLNTLAYQQKVNKGYSAVCYNGQVYRPNTDLFNAFFNVKSGKAHDTITLKDGLTRTENFWVAYDDPNGTIAVDFALDTLDFGPINYSNEVPSTNAIVQFFRCVPTGDPTAGTLTVIRASGESVNVALQLNQMPATQLALTRVLLPYYHKKQQVIFDFSQYSDIVSVLDSNQQQLATKQVAINGPQTFTVVLADTSFTSAITPYEVPYVENNASKPLYYSPTTNSYIAKTENVYMLNGVIYPFCQGYPFLDAIGVFEDLSAGTVKFTLSANVDSFGYYQAGRWTYVDVRAQPSFSPTYRYNVYSMTDSVDLNSFGIKSAKSAVAYYHVAADGTKTQMKSSLIPIKVADGTLPGGLAFAGNYTIVVDACEIPFSLNVMYERYDLLTYYVPNDDNFSSTKTSMRKRNFAGQFVCGNFIGDVNSPLLAYNVAVDGDCNVDPTYLAPSVLIPPVIKFASDNLATVQTAAFTYPLKTDVLTADMTIQATTFAKFNNCDNVVYDPKKSTITIPQKTGTCFFQADKIAFLLKSNIVRRASIRDPNSAATSAASTPTERSSSASPQPSSLSPSSSPPALSPSSPPSSLAAGTPAGPAPPTTARAPPTTAPAAPSIAPQLVKTAPSARTVVPNASPAAIKAPSSVSLAAKNTPSVPIQTTKVAPRPQNVVPKLPPSVSQTAPKTAPSVIQATPKAAPAPPQKSSSGVQQPAQKTVVVPAAKLHAHYPRRSKRQVEGL